MALITTISASTNCDCDEILISDTTGTYHATLNAGGWGSPNYALTDIVTSEFIVTLADATAYTIDATSLSTDAQGNYILPITSIGFAASTCLTDAIYEIVWEVYFGTESATTSVDMFSFCNAKNSVFGLIADAADNIDEDCACNTQDQEDALLAWTYYQALLYAGCCNDSTNFTKLLLVISALDDDNRCSNC
jgi:hypothetical protein